MIFFRILLVVIMMVANISLADNHAKNEELLEQVKEITQGLADESTENQNATDKAQEIVNQAQEEDEVPLNDPFAGN